MTIQPNRPVGHLLLVALFGGVFCASLAAAGPMDANRLTYLDGSDPYYVHRDFPKLVTPQWVGEEGVEAVVVLAIDDMRETARYEQYLRPILERLKQIDGRAPVSIMTCRLEPDDPQLQAWLKEGVSLETHSYDHPCPLLKDGDFARAKGTYDRCVDLLGQVPGSRPVAFRVPCCDSLNTPSPRFYAEIFNSTTPEGNFLQIDSSVFNVLTSDDPELPREAVLDADGRERFRRYVPYDRSFVNTIENYPYPYVIGRLCWQFPCITPSDWEAQHLQQPNNPRTVEDWKAALDCTVAKQGVFNLVFHPHGWIRAEQVNELIDHAVEKHGKKVKFLTFRECLERLNQNLLAGQPLRDERGRDNGVRLLDVNNDGYLDVVIGNQHEQKTRLWRPQERDWNEVAFPGLVVSASDVAAGRHPSSTRHPKPAARFGVLQPGGYASLILFARHPLPGGAAGGQTTHPHVWHFDGAAWLRAQALPEKAERPGDFHLLLQADQVRLRDIDADGECELLVSYATAHRRARCGVVAYAWSDEDERWKRSVQVPVEQWDHPILDGLRFVDLDEDGFDDVVFSDAESYAIHLWDAVKRSGWTRAVLSGRRGEKDPAEELPPIIRAGGSNNGFWVHSRHLWWQNEDTSRLKDLVDRRAFDELLKNVQPGPKSPEQSLKLIQPRPGFEVELVAAEPLVMDPIAFAWGPDGKFWVVEMGDYPLGVDGQGQPGGRVRYLEDSDGDGRYNRSTMFLENIGYPTGVAPWRKGVLVTCAPDIFYAEDTDGDGKADRREVLFTGFGQGNQQHRVNGLVWGIDNWFYGANGDSGGEITSIKTGQKVDIRGRDFRIDPGRGLIEAEAGQTQFGRSRDDWGNWFGCNNSNPMWHFALVDRYLRRNPHVAPPDGRVNVSEVPGTAPVYPVSRTLERFNDAGRANRFTSACSTMVYRDELFGPEFAGNSFVSEPVHNLVHRERMAAKGATFTSRRADDEQQSEFLASRDNWFRPAMIKTGPDGALWIADMYRHVIEHPEWIPAEWQARLDLRAGHDQGRIYRVYPSGRPGRPIPRLDRLDIPGLVAALDSPSGWQRDMAQQLLVEKQDPAAVPYLEKLALDSPRPEARLHALCTLEGLGGLRGEVLRPALHDAHPGVRRHAIRLSEAGADRDAGLLDELVKCVGDTDPHVRIQLAYTLGEWNRPAAAEALARLLTSDDDRFLRAAALSSIRGDNIDEVLAAVFKLQTEGAPPAELLKTLVGLAGAYRSDAALAEAIDRIATPAAGERFAPWQTTAVAGLLDALGRQNSSLVELKQQLSRDAASALERLAPLFEQARRAVADPECPESARVLATLLLGRGADEHQEDLERLGRLLTPQTPPAVQLAAVEALGRLDGPQIADRLLSGWKGYGPELRGRVLDVLLGREGWLSRLLAALESRQVLAADLDLARRRRLLEHKSEKVRQRAAELLAGAVDPNRQQVVEAYRSVLSLSGDLTAGAELFQKNCAACHRLGEIGHPVGPDLAALADRSPESLLVAILDPNRAVEAKFLNYVVATTDGRTFTGMLAEETGSSITLLGQENKREVVLRGEIEVLESSGKSMMPEGLEKEIAPQAMADLIAFVLRQTAPRKEFAGNQPRPLGPGADGSIRLPATAAEIYGRTLVLEEKYSNLGYWQSPDDHAVWTVEVPAGGRYDVWLDYASAPETAGDAYLIEVGAQRMGGTVESTGSWDNYRRQKVGAVDIPAGRLRLLVRPAGPIRAALLDLREIQLVPEK